MEFPERFLRLADGEKCGERFLQPTLYCYMDLSDLYSSLTPEFLLHYQNLGKHYI